MIWRVVPIAALAAMAACNPEGGRATLTARWVVAAESASITMPATVTWCPDPGRFDLRAFEGDTALGVAVYPEGTTSVAGSYPVLAPGGPVQIRPAAAVALRWMDKAAIQGWWGDSGAVSFTSGPLGGISGSGQLRLVSNLGPDSVTPLEFTFRGLRVKTDTLCDAPRLPVGIPLDSAAPADSPPAPGLD